MSIELAEELFSAVPDFILLGDRLPEYLREKFAAKLYLWRISTQQFLELFEAVGNIDGNAAMLELGAKVLAKTLGDANGPGMLDTPTGLAWLERQPQLLTAIAPFAFEFFGLDSLTQKKD